MFRLRRMGIDTLSEHVVFIAEQAVAEGALGFKPLDRVRVIGRRADGQAAAEVSGVLNFCGHALLARDEIGLSDSAFRDLGLPEGAAVEATHARAPESVERVRRKLRGETLSREDFDAILSDVCARRYAKPELAMFVLACALRRLDRGELIAFTEAMIACGSSLSFDAAVVADKHCIGGIPGNRTTLVVVPILAALGLTVPKTSSRAITSASGTADTMGVLAEVALSPERIRGVVERTGACIVWGGALDLAPADDVLITVERPMGIDTEGQMIASILSKKKTAGATHALIDLPVGRSAKVRSRERGEALAERFREVAQAIGLRVEVVLTEAHAPIGRGVGPRLEALDVLAVLKREPHAPADLREKSLYLAARLLECTGKVSDAGGYRAAQRALDSGAALAKFEEIVGAQGRLEPPPPAPFRAEVLATRDGRIRDIDCLEVNTIAKLAGAPANPAAGLCVLRGVDAVVARGEPLLELHAQSRAQHDIALEYANARPELFELGF
jgi:thymidine phosphorylase